MRVTFPILTLALVTSTLSAAQAAPPDPSPGTVVFDVSVDTVRSDVIRHGSSYSFGQTMDHDFVTLAVAGADVSNPFAPVPLWDPVSFDDGNSAFADVHAGQTYHSADIGTGRDRFVVRAIPMADSSRQRLGISFTMDSRNAAPLATLFATAMQHQSTMCYVGQRALTAASWATNAEQLPLSETALWNPRCGALWRYTKPTNPRAGATPHCDGYTGFGELSFTGSELFQLTNNPSASFTRTLSSRLDPTDCVAELPPIHRWLQDSSSQVVIRVHRSEVPVPVFGGPCDSLPLRPAAGVPDSFWSGTWSEGNWASDDIFVNIAANQSDSGLVSYAVDSRERGSNGCGSSDVTSNTLINVVRPAQADPFYTGDRFGLNLCGGSSEVRPAAATPVDLMVGLVGIKLMAYQIGCGVPRIRYLRQAADGSVITDVMLHRYQPVR